MALAAALFGTIAVAGAVSGFTGFVAHAGGPPVRVFPFGMKLDKTLYVATRSASSPRSTS